MICAYRKQSAIAMMYGIRPVPCYILKVSINTWAVVKISSNWYEYVYFSWVKCWWYANYITLSSKWGWSVVHGNPTDLHFPLLRQDGISAFQPNPRIRADLAEETLRRESPPNARFPFPALRGCEQRFSSLKKLQEKNCHGTSFSWECRVQITASLKQDWTWKSSTGSMASEAAQPWPQWSNFCGDPVIQQAVAPEKRRLREGPLRIWRIPCKPIRSG